MSQMALPLQLADHAVFASFLATGNEALVATLSAIAHDSIRHGCWMWGAHATGKTHLLQAVCEAAGDRCVYVPITMVVDAGPTFWTDWQTGKSFALTMWIGFSAMNPGKGRCLICAIRSSTQMLSY